MLAIWPLAHHKPRIASACARAALSFRSDMKGTHTKKREDGKQYGKGFIARSAHSHALFRLWQAALAFQEKLDVDISRQCCGPAGAH